MQEHAKSLAECQLEMSGVVKQDGTITLEVAEPDNGKNAEAEQKLVPKSLCRLSRKKTFNCRVDISACAKKTVELQYTFMSEADLLKNEKEQPKDEEAKYPC